MQFRKKPVVVDAFELTEEFFAPFIKNKAERFKPVFKAQNVSICDNYIMHVNERMYIVVRKDSHELYIRTLEGEMHASLGDWIITGVQGEIYPCKPDIFEQTYERV
jgi:hypothetical protein